MTKLQFAILMNGTVSIAFSIVNLILINEGPTTENFMVPTVEGFLIAMVLVSVLPIDKWSSILSERSKISSARLALVITAFINVTVITFILSVQAMSFNKETLSIWLKQLPTFYLTALLVSFFTDRMIESLTK
ncbi:hypothetical protein [Streptococcus moroccensis]|uniref:Integral membrane protein n=1 Tax=Streptococcus moroccensis TaxID=1451356 RepID=A0ABT9YQS0_9STRE|nr:hypothetical protein [Streptococcus moroccensis]MDQ0222344.1 hypothetical protein [Streptococcus moroccensis]